MTRCCAGFRRYFFLAAAASWLVLSVHAHAAITTSWNTNSSGSYTTAANWDNGVPGPDDTAEFNRGAGVVYTVTFPGGNYPINLFHVHTNNVTFADDGSPSSLTVASPAVIGESPGDVAILTTSLSNLSGTQASIGQFPGSNGTAIVTGAGSTWTNSSQLDVGLGGTGTMKIEAGGSVSNTVGNVATDPGSTGTVIVNGAGSTWINSLDLDIGESGTGTLTIEAGGTVSTSGGSGLSTIGTNADSTGTVTVTGAGSNWTSSGEISIGTFGAGTLAIEGSGSVSSSSAVIGDIFGSNGSATVTGIGSTWTNSGFLFVGDAGAGMLTIEAGGSVSNTNSRLGNFSGSTGTATVTGAGATWTNSNILQIGFSGTGTLTIEAGGSVSNTDGSLGLGGSGTGTATVTGVGSTWTNSANFTLSKGSLKIEAGGSVSNIDAIMNAPTGSTGTVTVTGAGSTWNSSGSVYVGGNTFADGGVGTLSVETGATVNIGDDVKLWGDGTVNLSGGQINLVDDDNLIFSGGVFNFVYGTLNFTTSQTIQAGGKIEQALGGERRVRVGQHLGVDGVATLNAPFHIDGGGLEVDSLAVNSNLLFTAGLLEVRGGSITGLTSLVVPASGEFRTSGVHSFRVTGLAGSTITATGALTLGNASAVNGFGTQGTVQVGPNTLTLLDANDVVFDSLALATLGSGVSPGTLSAANGLTLDFGGNITGFGTVSTPNLITKPLINNGHITGNSAAQRITLPGYVKGVGTLDNVNLTGTFSPGLSPTTITVGNLAFAPTSTLILEIGGLTPGSEHDQIISSGQLAFDGNVQVTLINSFSPSSGQSFNIFDWATTSGTFDNLTLPVLGAGLTWNTSQLYTDGVLSIAAGVPGDYNGNGSVDAADYVLWRKGGPLQNEVDAPGIVNAADYAAWRARFGNSGSGSGSAFNTAAIPEPTSLVIIGLAVVALLHFRATSARPFLAP